MILLYSVSFPEKQCFDMLIIRLMHIADMPSIPELLKQNQNAQSQQPTPKVEVKTEPEKPKFVDIKTSEELAHALHNARELLLYSYYSNNLEIINFEIGKIKYFDRKKDKDFSQKLSLWLKDATGKPWELESVEQPQHQQTVVEHAKSEIAEDPMVAAAMGLFEDAEIVNISK